MNSRQRKELHMLIEHGSLNVNVLATFFSLSKRQIRYDISDLNSTLKSYVGFEAVSIHHNVIHLHPDVTSQSLIALGLLDGTRDFNKNPLSVKERILLSAFYIAWSSDRYITMQEIADNFSVSYDTVVRDMAEVRKYYCTHHTELISKAGKGFRIKAKETARRQILSALVKDYKKLSNFHATFNPHDYEEFFSLEVIQDVAKIVSNAEDFHSILLDDASFEAIVIHVLLSVKRFQTTSQGAIQADHLSKIPEPLDEACYKIASYIVQHVNEYFAINLPSEELFYIGLHVGLYGWRSKRDTPQVNTAIELSCSALISAVDSYMRVGFKRDKKLYISLIQHVAAAVNRHKAHFTLINPLREELIGEYGDLYNIICRESSTCGLDELISPTEDELTYILVHFGAALVRIHREDQRKPRVMVVCATGIGTAELLASRLTQQFSLEIVSVVSAHHLATMSFQNIDFVISTLPSSAVKISIPWITVSPLLDKEDATTIAIELGKLGFYVKHHTSSKQNLSSVAKELQKLVMKYPNPEDETCLISALHSYLEAHVGGGEDPMLSDLLHERHIVLDAECDGWQASVKVAGQPLLESGEITPAYVEKVIENITEYGPYVVITKGIALAHASSSVGVNKTGMSLVRLKTPVAYGNASNDPVTYVFMLASTGPETHMTALQCLSELLQDHVSTTCMATARHPTEIVEQIKRFEKTMAATMSC